MEEQTISFSDAVFARLCPQKKKLDLFLYQKLVVKWGMLLELNVFNKQRNLMQNPPLMKGGIAAISMGLGKTIMILVMASILFPFPAVSCCKGKTRSTKTRSGKSLIVCEASVLDTFVWHWKQYFCEFDCDLSPGAGQLVIVHGKKEKQHFLCDHQGIGWYSAQYPRKCDRCGTEVHSYVHKASQQNKGKSDLWNFMQGVSVVYITTYRTLVCAHRAASNTRDSGTAESSTACLYGPESHFDKVYLDESHNLGSSSSSAVYCAVAAVSRSVTFCFSGTPFRNSFSGLFQQMSACGIHEGEKSTARKLLPGLAGNDTSLLMDRDSKEASRFFRDYFICIKNEDIFDKQSRWFSFSNGKNLLAIPNVSYDTAWVTLSAEEKLCYDRYLSDCQKMLELETKNEFLQQAHNEEQEENDVWGEEGEMMEQQQQHVDVAVDTSLRQKSKSKSSQQIHLLFKKLQIACSFQEGNKVSSKFRAAADIIFKILHQPKQRPHSAGCNSNFVVFSPFPKVLRAFVLYFNHRKMSEEGCCGVAEHSEQTCSTTCNWWCCNAVVIDGSTPVATRRTILANLDNSKTPLGRNSNIVTVLCTTYKICGVGINLTKIRNAVFLDNAWDSETKKQAIGRILRIGSCFESVKVYSIVAKDTADEFLFQTNHTSLADMVSGMNTQLKNTLVAI